MQEAESRTGKAVRRYRGETRTRRQVAADRTLHRRNEQQRRRRQQWRRPNQQEPMPIPQPRPLEAVIEHLRSYPTVPLQPNADDGTLAYCMFKSRRDGDVVYRLCRVRSCGRVTATVQFFDTGEVMTRVWVTSMFRILYQ